MFMQATIKILFDKHANLLGCRKETPFYGLVEGEAGLVLGHGYAVAKSGGSFYPDQAALPLYFQGEGLDAISNVPQVGILHNTGGCEISMTLPQLSNQ
jgi:hypothetical protein